MSSPTRHRSLAIASFIVLAFASKMVAQGLPPLPATYVELNIAKQSTIRQISATGVQEEGCTLTIRVFFGTMPPADGIDLRAGNSTLHLYRDSNTAFKFQSSYSDRAKMEAALPAGPCTVVTPSASHSFTIPAIPIDAKVTNFDALQRWDGGNNIPVTVGPTPSALSFSERLAVGMSQGSLGGLGGDGLLTSPSTTVTASVFELRLPTTLPGEVLAGKASFSIARTTAGATPESNLYLNYGCTINFPLTRAYLPPQITTQPVAQTVNAGASVALSVGATGSGLTYLWRKDSLPVAGATNATLSFAAAKASDSGVYTVVVTNTGGSVTSAPTRLTVNEVTQPPTVATAPAGTTLVAGSSHTLTVTAGGTPPFSYQWFRDGTPIPGATASSLAIDQLRLADAGRYAVAITNSAGTVTSAPTTVNVTPVGRISNLSIRTRVGGSSGVLTVGLTVGGGTAAASKPLLLRAVGPTLGAFGVDAALADPQIALLSGANVIAQNDDWGGTTLISDTAQAVGAFALANGASKDAALIPATTTGGYTMRITGAGSSSGIALAEVYDATVPNTFFLDTPKLINVSALTQVGTGSDILIAGFSIAGTPKTVLVRGIGPTLAVFGVTGALADPKLEIYLGSSAAPIATSDNWSDAANSGEIARAAGNVGAFTLANGTKDSALLVTLEPGSYTAQVSGVNNTTGTALVEIYEVP